MRFHFLDEIPALICRARDTSVACRILSMCQEKVEHGLVVHRAIAPFFDPLGPLRGHFERFARGEPMEDALSSALQPYEWLLLDEATIEGEHRNLRVEAQRAHGLRHAFGASTVRLPQHAEMIEAARADEMDNRLFRRCWASWRLPAARHSFVPMGLRVPTELRSLRMTSACERIYRLGSVGFEDHRALIPLCSEAGARCYVKPTEREWLAVEYFSKLLVAGMTYSVPIADADDWVAIVAAASPEQPWVGQRISGDELEASHPARRFFQVLHKSPSSLKVITDSDVPVYRSAMLVQPLVTWQPTASCASVDCFPESEPALMSVHTLAPWGVMRSAMREWVHGGPSDVQGCMHLRSSGFVSFSASHPLEDLPLACQLEALADLGWRAGRASSLPHRSLEDKLLCLEPGFVKRPLYFVCLRCLGVLMAQGLKELHCGQLDSYYAVALRAMQKEAILPGLADSHYRLILKGQDCAPAVPACLIDKPATALAVVDEEFQDQPCVSFQGMSVLLPRGSDASQGSSEDGGADLEFLVDDLAPVVFDGKLAARAEAHEGSVASWTESMRRLHAEWVAAKLPMEIDGVRITLEANARCDRGGYIRLRCVCSNPTHGNQCRTSRSLGLSKHFGMAEVYGYLACWLFAGISGEHSASRASHQSYKPSLSSVRDTLRTRGISHPTL